MWIWKMHFWFHESVSDSWDWLISAHWTAVNLVELDIDTPVVSVDSKPTQSSKTLHVSVNYSGQMSLHPQSHPFTSFTQSSSVCVCVCVCVCTLLQALWSSTLSIDKAIIFTPRFLNSSVSFAAQASSVVQTGVKSLGWENRIPHLHRKTQSHTRHLFKTNLPCYWVFKAHYKISLRSFDVNNSGILCICVCCSCVSSSSCIPGFWKERASTWRKTKNVPSSCTKCQSG